MINRRDIQVCEGKQYCCQSYREYPIYYATAKNIPWYSTGNTRAEAVKDFMDFCNKKK